MKIPVVTEITPEQRGALSTEKLDQFFSSVPADLRERVTSLPKRIAQMNARISIKLQEVLRTADLMIDGSCKQQPASCSAVTSLMSAQVVGTALQQTAS